MGNRRMFANTIISSGKFLRMPPTSRLLYYDLGMAADDDGVVEAYSVMQMTKATEDDLRVLIAKGYIQILNEELVAFITDWKVNNYIRSDRYTPSVYSDLIIKLTDGEQVDAIGIPSGYQMDTQVKLSKDKLSKDKLSQDKEPKAPAAYFPADEKLNDAFIEFIKMRKTIKKPLTDNAIKRVLSKLDKLAGNDNDLAINILYQSIDHCWQDLYPLKEAKPKQDESCWDSLMRTLEEEDG